jgi:histidinol dehydrogenase
MDVCNVVAPEHLELITADPDALVPLVKAAGAVFCGPWAPASVGDYVAGPSHVLPTARSARFSSALGTQDFLKRVHVIRLDRQALRRVGPLVAAIAEAEGLAAHAESVTSRAGDPVTPMAASGPTDREKRVKLAPGGAPVAPVTPVAQAAR